MTASILSTLLLLSPAPLPSGAQPPSLVEPHSNAWAVVHAGQLWVCWTPGPDCFERVVFDDEAGAPDDTLDDDTQPIELADALRDEPEFAIEAWQLGFWGPRSLWVERGEQRWRVLAGQRRARVVEDPAPIRLRRISPPSCGPGAVVPGIIGGRLSWRDAPRCAVEHAAQTCVSTAGPRLRTPSPVRLRAGIELARIRGWTAQNDAALTLAIAERRRSIGIEVSFVAELGFDWQRRTSERRARAVIARRGRTQLRELPTVVPGPRAAAELEALAEVVCHGSQP